jgi:signal transduction histidine kinase
MRLRRNLSWGGPPLALQIMALLLGGLVVAQLVTLVLTLLLPPAPQPQYNLADVAAVLRGGEEPSTATRALQREIQSGPPRVAGPGWLESDKSRRELARLTGVDPDRVMLAFYTPLPFAGTAVPRSYAMANDGMVADWSDAGPIRPASLLLAQYRPPAGGAAGAPILNGGPLPDAIPLPPIARPGGAIVPGVGRPRLPGGAVARPDRTGTALPRPPIRDLQPDGAVADRWTRGERPALPNFPGAATPQSSARPGVYGPPRPRPAVPPLARPPLDGFGVGSAILVQPEPSTSPPPAPEVQAPAIEPARTEPVRAPVPVPAPAPSPAPVTAEPPAASLPPPSRAPAVQPAPAAAEPLAEPVLVPQRRSLFGLAPAPYVEGDFIAGLRLADGRWAVVHPAPAGFFDGWQRRVLLWFALALALVAPFGWLFARRLVKPLQGFADAAEQLGRDPAAVIGTLDGPAEIGRAAHAFNQMQSRLRSFVDDRTAMIGAISHDLRTPLTRMRFRIEDVPDGVRDGLLEEVDEMEAMISQVIEFIRDASTPGARERLDLRSLIDDVVEDVRLVGGDVQVDRAEAAPVEVDVLGMRRLLDNLLENAIKYGARARVRLTTDVDTAVAEIIDDGPGMPDEELERAFEPFYRAQAAQASQKSGSGLGLAVCRSIARAHGGDVRLINAPEGFCAEVRVPLAYGAEAAA